MISRISFRHRINHITVKYDGTESSVMVCSSSTPHDLYRQFRQLRQCNTMPHHSHRRSRVEDAASSKRPDRRDSSHRHRSKSPHRNQHKRKRSSTPSAIHLPSNARRLSKHDFDSYKVMFALYLDIQKQLVLEELEPDEVKGRWKSFVGKW